MKKTSKHDKKAKSNVKTKNKSDNKDKTKSNKKYTIIAIVLIALIILGVYLFTGGDSKVAYLSAVNGNVEVYSNGAWEMAIQGQEILLNDKIKTSASSTANLIILGKTIVNLDENTEIEVTSLLENEIKIKQTTGSTWNKFLGIVGVDSYEVESPNAVASVRGTEFGFDVTTEECIILVGEGIVNFGNEGGKIDLKELEKAGVINDVLMRLNLTDADLLRIRDKKSEVVNSLKRVRQAQIENLGPLITFVRKTYGMSDEDIQMKLDSIDRGEINDSEIIEQAPFKKDDLRVIKRLNDEIKKTQREIEVIDRLRANATQN